MVSLWTPKNLLVLSSSSSLLTLLETSYILSLLSLLFLSFLVFPPFISAFVLIFVFSCLNLCLLMFYEITKGEHGKTILLMVIIFLLLLIFIILFLGGKKGFVVRYTGGQGSAFSTGIQWQIGSWNLLLLTCSLVGSLICFLIFLSGVSVAGTPWRQ